jgi:hypothetical protein
MTAVARGVSLDLTCSPGPGGGDVVVCLATALSGDVLAIKGLPP